MKKNMLLFFLDNAEKIFSTTEIFPSTPRILFENTYIGKGTESSRKPPRLPLDIWNVWDEIFNNEPTTNNQSERWFRQWRTRGFRQWRKWGAEPTQPPTRAPSEGGGLTKTKRLRKELKYILIHNNNTLQSFVWSSIALKIHVSHFENWIFLFVVSLQKWLAHFLLQKRWRNEGTSYMPHYKWRVTWNYACIQFKYIFNIPLKDNVSFPFMYLNMKIVKIAKIACLYVCI